MTRRRVAVGACCIALVASAALWFSLRAEAESEVRAVAIDPKRVLADAVDFRVTAHDLAAAINAKSAWIRATYLPTGRLEDAARQMARERLLSAEARRRRLELRPEVKAELERVLARALVESEVQRLDSVPVREADIQTYYAAHAAKEYTRPERIRVATIVLSDLAAAKRQLPKLKRLKGKKFEKKAKELSEETGLYLASTDAGWMFREPGNVDPLLVQAAWELKKPYDMTAVSGTDGRAYILRLEEYEAMEVYSLDKVRLTIASRIRHQRRHDAVEALLHRLSVQQGLRVNAVAGSVKMSGAPPSQLPDAAVPPTVEDDQF